MQMQTLGTNTTTCCNRIPFLKTQILGPIYTDGHSERFDNSAMMPIVLLSLKTMELLQNGITTHFQATQLLPSTTKLRRLCFYRRLSVHRWGVPDQVHPQEQTAPGTRYTPRARYTPRSRHPPDQVHPPGADTPLGLGTPPGPGIPPWSRHTPPDQVPPRTRYTPMGPGTPQSRHPPDQVHPPGTKYTPRDKVHPPGPGTTPWDQVPPQSRHPPDQVHPPGTRYTSPDQVHSPRPGKPPRDQVHPPDQVPPGTRYTPPSPEIRPPLRWYASYWNAFLFRNRLVSANPSLFPSLPPPPSPHSGRASPSEKSWIRQRKRSTAKSRDKITQ